MVLQAIAHLEGGAHHIRPGNLRVWIEIEGDAVGRLDAAELGAPDMDLEHRGLHERDQSLERLDGEELLAAVGVAAPGDVLADASPGVLLEEATLCQALFRHAGVRPQNTVGMGER